MSNLNTLIETSAQAIQDTVYCGLLDLGLAPEEAYDLTFNSPLTLVDLEPVDDLSDTDFLGNV